MNNFDLIIIGGGPAGMAAAKKAVSLGARVALVEKGMVGGASANISCVPTKDNFGNGEVIHLAKRANHRTFRRESRGRLSFKKAMKEARDNARVLRRLKYQEMLESLPDLYRIKGRAKFVDANHIGVDGDIVGADRFIVTTGASPVIPPIDGLEKTGFMTYKDVFNMTKRPSSLLILGAGPYGLEFAQMFARFGTEVTVVERKDQILQRIDFDIGGEAGRLLESEGISLRVGERAVSVAREGEKRVIECESKKGRHHYQADEILVAVGREPNTKELDIEGIGLATDDRQALVVDDEFVSNIENIYAAGDVIGEPMLENLAAKEGEMAAENAVCGTHLQMDYDSIPSCVFIHPEIAQVGLTEAEAARRNHMAETRALAFKHVPKARVSGATRGLIKMTVARQTRRILGVSIFAEGASEMINEAAAAVKFQLSVEDLSNLVNVYPTRSEALTLVAGEFAGDGSAMREAIRLDKKAA